MTPLTASPEWQALEAHAAGQRHLHLRELFAEDRERFRRFSLRLDDLLLDYSKNRVTAETMRLLLDLARFSDVEGWRARMFQARRSISPRTARCCTSHCATGRAGRSWSTARM